MNVPRTSLLSWAGVVSVINGNCVYLNELGVGKQFRAPQPSNQTDDTKSTAFLE